MRIQTCEKKHAKICKPCDSYANMQNVHPHFADELNRSYNNNNINTNNNNNNKKYNNNNNNNLSLNDDNDNDKYIERHKDDDN